MKTSPGSRFRKGRHAARVTRLKFALILIVLSHLPVWADGDVPSLSISKKTVLDLATSESTSGHWSFQAVSRPPVPPLQAPPSSNLRTEIDAFVSAELAQESDAIRPEADRRTLIRRVYFDLIGLPPSPEEAAAFIVDPDPRTYERLVNRLLTSPHYGERWGRHWLDVGGFAESSMFIGDVPRQGFWRYRDYVIRAFNEDKPFDRFVIEQLAGDELFNWRDADLFTPEQVDLLAATGFLRCAPDATDNQAITQMDKRYVAQQTAVEVSMKALMGLTINCVRCHDHKFDPIKQEEYYRLISVFQPVYDPDQWLPGIWSEGNIGPLRAIPLLPGNERRNAMEESLGWHDARMALDDELRHGIERPFRDQWLREHLAEISDEPARHRIAALLSTPGTERTEEDEVFCAEKALQLGLTEEKIKELFPEIEKQKTAAKARLQELRDRNKEVFKEVIWAAFDTSPTPTSARFLNRGNYETPGHTIEPGVIAAVDQPDRTAQFDRAPGEWTTGRRLALARWLTHPGHPLVARVMVNRIWQYHFGTGIVSTPDDFGARGSRPASQELLDWLAAEFVENGWSVKHIHRLILNSATFRQETANRAGLQFSRTGTSDDLKDSTDHGISNAAPISAFVPGPRRVEAEAIRDALLEVSGRLDRRLFGPSVPTERRGDGSFGVKQGHADRLRRTVYIHTRRTYVPTLLTLFDEPQMDTNWPKRSTSAIAQQALAQMNEPFVIECAGAFANRVMTEGRSSFDDRLRRAFELAYQRAPSEDEVALFRRTSAGIENPWPVICQALFSSSEFLYVD
ncbi:MAG: DUF1549 and DUF1553 domain-containing protein [Verrucomicrobia bacterium]|nr:DUF1549 and DUF1553 domain-containing protein [Verrucomicrobiota bacterium]